MTMARISAGSTRNASNCLSIVRETKVVAKLAKSFGVPVIPKVLTTSATTNRTVISRTVLRLDE